MIYTSALAAALRKLLPTPARKRLVHVTIGGNNTPAARSLSSKGESGDALGEADP